MNNLTTAAFVFLGLGIFTSVSILSGYQVLIVVPVLFYSYLAFKNKNFKLPTSAYWLAAFLVIAAVSLLFNLDTIPKPSKNFGRLKYYLFGITQIYILRFWIKESSDKIIRAVVYVFLAGIIVAGVYAIGEFIYTDFQRVKSLTDTMRYGYGSSMLLLTLLSALLHREKLTRWFDARVGLTAFILGFLGMYVTYTRGGLLAFICGLPFVLIFYRMKLGLIVGGAAALVVGVLGGFYLFGNVQKGEGSRFLMTQNNSGDVIRRSQWKAAIIATKEKPVLGWGLSNFHSQLKRIKEENNLDAKDYNDAHAHNLFLETSSGTGLVGLFLFLAWLLTWAWEILKSDPLTRALIIPFGVAFVVGSQFEVTFDANNVSMIFFVYALSVFRRQNV